jgi:hypothetical protein
VYKRQAARELCGSFLYNLLTYRFPYNRPVLSDVKTANYKKQGGYVVNARFQCFEIGFRKPQVSEDELLTYYNIILFDIISAMGAACKLLIYKGFSVWDSL